MFDWQPHDAGFRCAMPGNITLDVFPERHAKGFVAKPARGTKWRAAASIFDGKFTISRYGRDEYMNLQASVKDAMRLAEDIYKERNS
jgi:hypothetical protein